MTSTRTVLIASLTALTTALTGCATDAKPSKPTVERPPAVALAGTNGDMSKYLGTWSSGCGREYRPNAAGTAVLTSGVNSFSLKSVSGNTVQGRLTVDTYESRDCSGPPKRTSENITLTYAANIPVTSSYGEATRFTGSADKVTATMPGAGGADSSTTFNVGFLENFTRFQLAPVDYFSSTNLVYTKQK